MAKWILALMLTCISFTTSSAAVVTITYTGTLTAGFDGEGLFAGKNSDLSGYKFSLVYVYDTNIGTRFNDGISDNLVGGNASGSPSPTIYSSITINNKTAYINGAEVSVYDAGFFFSGMTDQFASDLQNNPQSGVLQ